MKTSDFWFFSLVALLIMAAAVHWNVWSCIAVAANSLVVLADVARALWRHRRQEP